ncbi:Fungal Zn(2)-Cys(6) binuclear cluster domain [Ceratobasidium sp. AG-Ba]|nr:Fungal Zn(2)-Cys(6) binuclear cluster domain [Ceratobasidium sp. AG-Ba]
MPASARPSTSRPYLAPIYSPEFEEWSRNPLFSPQPHSPLSATGSEGSDDLVSEATEPGSSGKRHRSISDDDDCEPGRKPSRSARACKSCRKAKAKCVQPHGQGENAPCMRCSASGKDCVFVDANPKRDLNRRFAALQKQVERMEEMHRLLDQALLHQSRPRSHSPPTQPAGRF